MNSFQANRWNQEFVRPNAFCLNSNVLQQTESETAQWLQALQLLALLGFG
jgi:hypothetical protein